MILAIITQYPEFKELYSQLYEICRNMEQVMGMFSKELQILDRNTVQYMIDEMQETIDRQKEELEEARKEIKEKEQLYEEYQKLVQELAELKEKNDIGKAIDEA
jgi:flagellar biosynthesis chaperone FliJ